MQRWPVIHNRQSAAILAMTKTITIRTRFCPSATIAKAQAGRIAIAAAINAIATMAAKSPANTASEDWMPSDKAVTTRFALFHDGKQISKAHSTRLAVVHEGFEQGAVIRYSVDFLNDALRSQDIELADGYEIREVP